MAITRALKTTLAAAVAAMAVATTAAADYPEVQVRMIVPFPPGGGTDILGRILAQELSEMWGQPVVVENRPGAAGAIGARAVMQSDADGYTLLMASTGAILRVAREATSDGGTFAVENSLAPITLVAAPPYIAVVHPDVEAQTIEELIALAKKNPGKLSYGSSGAGSASHLTGALFQQMTQVEFLHVPYSGMGQAVTDLLSGQFNLMFAPAPVVRPHIEAGTLRPLAVTSAERSGLFPDYPAIVEAGVPGFASVGWFGLLAPAGTPEDVIAKIGADAAAALGTDAVRNKLAEQGAEPAAMSPEAFRDFINEDIVKWLEIAKGAQ